MKCNGLYKFISKEIGVADIIIKRWVLAYKSFGEVAFDVKGNNANNDKAQNKAGNASQNAAGNSNSTNCKDKY